MHPIVTPEDIAKAQTELDTATAELTAIEREAAEMRGPVREDRAATIGLVVARHRQAQGKLDTLRERQAEQTLALAARGAREQDAAGELDAVDSALQDSAARLRELVATAEAALVDALRHGIAHDALVARSRVQLQRLDLLDETGRDHATAAGPRVGLRLRGTWWSPVDAAALLSHTVARVARCVLGASHIVAMRAHTAAQGQRLDAQLLSGLPDLEAVAVPRPTFQPPARDRQAPPAEARAPYLERVAAAVSRVPEALRWPAADKGEQ